MNNKLIGVIIVVLVVIGALLIFGNKGSYKGAQQTQPQQQPAGQSKAGEVTVTVSEAGFAPQILTIKAGTRVVWMNKSGQAVTVNSAPHPAHTAYPPLNLGEFADGSSVQLVFDKPGEYKYHNHLNPTQFGTIVVK